MKSIIIHGGAWNMPKELEEPHLRGVKEACRIGKEVLESDGKSIDAVVESLTYLEEDDTFDAGVGSFLNSNGVVELDAGIMIGNTKDFASCGSVTKIRNPIKLCKLMMEISPNKLLVCEGAHQFAKAHGFELIDNVELIIERELKRYNERFGPVEKYFHPSDTVGAVAIDDKGVICVGNTTGGTPGKPPGRVGDSPLVGCGIYAGDDAGIAATGLGEPIIKTVLSKTIYDLYRGSRDLSLAVMHGIKELSNYGWGGVIALDRYGNYVAEHNTEKMPFGYWNEKEGKIKVNIRRDI